MPKERLLGIDIGGSSVKVGLIVINKQGVVTLKRFEEQSYPSSVANRSLHKSEITGEERIELALTLINSVTKNEKIDAIGVSTTGTVDKHGSIIDAQNESYVGINWPQILFERFHEDISLHIINDAKAAAWAEYEFWSEKTSELHLSPDFEKHPSTFVHVIIGAGVGSGIIINAQIHQGANGVAGEIGSIMFSPNDPELSPADVESFSSSAGILRTTRLLSQGNTVFDSILEVNDAYSRGDLVARKSVDIAVQAMGHSLVALVNILGPNIITFGGGTIDRIGVYLESLSKFVTENAEQPAVKDLIMRKGKFPKEGGVLGAAMLAYNRPQQY